MIGISSAVAKASLCLCLSFFGLGPWCPPLVIFPSLLQALGGFLKLLFIVSTREPACYTRGATFFLVGGAPLLQTSANSNLRS